MPVTNLHAYPALPHTASLQKFVQHILTGHGNLLIKMIRSGFPEVHKGFFQNLPQFIQEITFSQLRQVHLIDKQKCGNPVSGEKTPQRPRMLLNPIRPADHQDRIIQNLEGTFHFRRKIHVARRIEQRHLHVLPFQYRLL